MPTSGLTKDQTPLTCCVWGTQFEPHATTVMLCRRKLTLVGDT